jgi:hypothetical protein
MDEEIRKLKLETKNLKLKIAIWKKTNYTPIQPETNDTTRIT